MIVTLLEKMGGIKREVGTVEILRKPVTKVDDFKLTLKDVLTFDQVKELADKVPTLVCGTIGNFDWHS